MVNAPSANNQPIPGAATTRPGPCPPDCDLPENSKENLDARLDHAIEETFPTSDPIAVVVTKKATAQDPEEMASAAPGSQSWEDEDQAEQETAERLLDQVREALRDVADTASGTAREAYQQGKRHIREAGNRYLQAERVYRKSRSAIHQRVSEHPVLVLLAAGAAGYVLARVIHGQPRSRDRRIPDYGRTRWGYAPHRDTQHEG